MKAVLATFERELRAYFCSPLAYVLLTFFLLINGYVFSLIVSYLSDPRAGIGEPFQLLFGGTFLFWILMLFIGPAITMRLLSEERRSGTIEVLMTAPISELEVVLGKYFASVVLYVVLWLPTLVYTWVIARNGEVDWGPIASGYLGVLGIGSLFLAIGIFTSAFTRNQVLSAIASFALLFLFFSPAMVAGLVNGPQWLKDALSYVDLLGQMDDFARGIVDTRALVYYMTTTAFFLFLTARALEAKKWR